MSGAVVHRMEVDTAVVTHDEVAKGVDSFGRSLVAVVCLEESSVMCLDKLAGRIGGP